MHRLFGIETEYAFTALGSDGNSIDRGETVAKFMEFVRVRTPHLPDKHSGGTFLAGGGRFYRDSGNHPELTTPEVHTPWEAARYLAAGDLLMKRMAAEFLESNSKFKGVVLTKCNFSYGGAPTTWACHESYGHQAQLGDLPAHLVQHFVSRIALCGGGGFSNRSHGIEFMISPRVAHLCGVVTDESQSNRGIYHTKNESLSQHGWHRLHVLCGESLCSETSNVLKIGTTALVVAMIEAGLKPGAEVQLAAPLAAMQRFAADTTLTARAKTHKRRNLTAIQIQRVYLEQAEKHADADFMPDWASDMCRLWRRILDELEADPASQSRRLDWAIKLTLFRRMAENAGVDWESLPIWNQVLSEIAPIAGGTTFNRASIAVQPLPLHATKRNFDKAAGAGRAIVKGQQAVLEENGLSWSGLDDVLGLRRRLFELDTRFGELSDQGVFYAMDAAGVLDHHAEGVRDVEGAILHPPPVGRGRLRGECIRRFASQRQEYCCGWSGVWDLKQNRFLDLSDPFTEEEVWADVPPEQLEVSPFDSRRSALYARHLQTVYDRGAYRQAASLFQSLIGSCASASVVGLSTEHESVCNLSRLPMLMDARQGENRGLGMLSERTQTDANSYDLNLIADYTFTYRFRGLISPIEAAVWIDRGRELLAENRDQDLQVAIAFREHEARWLFVRRRYDAALQTAALVVDSGDASHRLKGRALTTTGEVHRVLGNFGEANAALEQAATLLSQHGLLGDLAEYTLNCQAKLEIDDGKAAGLFERALTLHQSNSNLPGEARTLLLRQRRMNDGRTKRETRSRIEEIQAVVPALSECRRLAAILENWDAWAEGEPLPQESDDFYWGV